jgi:hypothetical protein
MHFLNSLKIWLLTNISGALILTLYLATKGEAEGEIITEFIGLVLFMFAFGLLFSIPAIPVLFLTLHIADETPQIPAKIIILLLGSVLAVFGVLLIDSQLLDMKLTSDYGESLLEFTWPHIFTAIISTFIVTGRSIFNSANHSNFEKEVSHES